ncbi:hypothetical protein LFWB_6040 [Candidatus Phytoplasma luffae]|uniref:Peptidase M41 domain-containing protein n=1 Tax=Loofah witches'-broom phytoplasma TaxID=35773 RepID=A0A975IM74_LOWBP|nr:hypothetical protein [Candidatus Phytoplasma luffae]QTX03170.1 hypothetical protein LFWB_6040 [Candidatus Phytoplasma luffae]
MIISIIIVYFFVIPLFKSRKDLNKINNLEEEKFKTTCHESGHVLSACILGRQLHSISIQKQNNNIDRYTGYLRKHDNDMEEKDYLDEVIINLSGRASEKILFNDDGGKSKYSDYESHVKEEINKLFTKFTKINI